MLYLFTATFPYGTAEPFLEDEIKYLKEYFSEITIVPLSGSGEKRNVPNGVNVLKPVFSTKRSKFFKGLFHCKSFFIIWKDFVSKKVFLNKTRFRQWLAFYFNTNCALKSDSVKMVSKLLKTSDICYFYWGKGLNALSLFWKGRAKMVSRFHGEWDLWEENSGGYAPCRIQLSEALNLAVFVSKKGEEYFKSRYPDCKTAVYPLGTLDYGECQGNCDERVLRVASCSTIYPLKRVPMIFETLNGMTSYEIEWTHLGGGRDYELLKQKVNCESQPHLTTKLLGIMTHDEVMAYYKNHHFDVFINLSTNEGVPVSIMEAESFNIPVVATNVGGTSEVVTEQSGVLVSANPSLDEVRDAIAQVKNAGLSPREFWISHYNADKNYTNFSIELSKL